MDGFQCEVKRDYEINEKNEIDEIFVYFVYFVIPLLSLYMVILREKITCGNLR